MRIIAGTHRGTTLADVGKGDASAHLRPTSDRVRESLFNVLQGGRLGDPISGARVLDLFAGTGALGLEALSRGAAHVTFVDSGRVAQKLIKDNIAKLGRQTDSTVVATDARKLPAGALCDLIFLDPPYGQNLGLPALQAAQAKGWIAPDALIVWEENQPQIAPAGFQKLDQRRYGDTWITVMRHAP
ncbi:16S rRNA (guanine(966)-N(2))-methyltransferase RsmD [Yoonia sediminilitoris]|uniref:16S rRNA (Guanine966-N2)-methyltransferase n=1 Tax=Yoonia sediminilitoris TaxID=1286148 RepID=A0A2T6KIP2_9RHOB|nr:16S rRNA (guanine(966)-N(2))-methyltransferase RsmD [Yoonia sediminilitoris]PUB15531.1 16S rRNA (guanine966-N2)-methyltransferase [Yoonia sediminilitoris]RCW96140.1 16S rRNA (guanine966-N2)-methyltransferase [Yoonia sediminilitoris]